MDSSAAESELAPEELAEILSSCRAPFLIGIRHHSPACAAAIPHLLDGFAPERLLIELPADLQPWLEWLGHPDLEAPVALSAADGDALAFYPFADFSPELAAIRWAVQRQTPLEAFDAPTTSRHPRGASILVAKDKHSRRESLLDAFLRAGEAEGVESLWDRLVESRAALATPEEVRRAGLTFGAGLRLDAARRNQIDREDLFRESHMRARIAAAKETRTAAVIGSFHAAALLPVPLFWSEPEPFSFPEPPLDEKEKTAARRRSAADAKSVSSLLPYAFDLLDSRSGYPAGIRDPIWQQRVLATLQAKRNPEEIVGQIAVEICRMVRAQGHAAGVPDAQEVVRIALDLSRLRGLPGPGRRELLEAIQTALGQGELMGRGRVLARALQRILVGDRRGRIPREAPRSGLAPHIESLCAQLRLPAPDQPAAEPSQLRLDPLRSDLDRRRHVVLERLSACGIPYAKREMIASLGETESLASAWTIRATPATQALIERLAIRGATLAQATEGSLRAARVRLEIEEQWTAKSRLALLERAAASGLHALTTEWLLELAGPFLNEAGLAELVSAAALFSRIVRGHVPALPREEFPAPAGLEEASLMAAAVRALEGLQGSDRLEDAQSLLELSRFFEGANGSANALGDGRLVEALRRLAREGSPLLQGAATAALVLLGKLESEWAGRSISSWLDAADLDARRALSARLRGLLVVIGPRLEIDAGLLDPLVERVGQLADLELLERISALREGFEVLTPAARQRLLDQLAGRYQFDRGERRSFDAPQEFSPLDLVAMAEADLRAKASLTALGLIDLAIGESPTIATTSIESKTILSAQTNIVTPQADPAIAKTTHAISPIDRWRLILGRERPLLPAGPSAVARALDELYGSGKGEGSRRDLSPAGGREPPFPSVREWSQELEALFGSQVREEVLGRAAARGRTAAALAIDPETVTPSIELLEQILSLKGAVPEGQLTQLRRLVARIVEELVRALAVRVQPAFAGLSMPRPTRRRGGALDLRRTISRNLRTARAGPDGAMQIIPERPYFRTRTRRSLDWRIILVVDVSGSMEASVIYSALMAAILAALPAVSVHFLAFSTEVIDLSSRVQDPLGLLLEVAVGGGTHIAQALRHARSLITIPSRSLVITVSDFEEGFSVDALVAEVRALCESGATALGLAALDDAGKPRYDAAIAGQLVDAGMPIAALTPLELARWVAEQLQ